MAWYVCSVCSLVSITLLHIANFFIVCLGKKSTKIVVQQDNATAHKAALSEQVSIAIKATGLKIEFENQPARSPDFNILDLGFFNAIQALQHRKKVFEIVSLVSAVEEAFAELEGTKIDKCFMTLQSVMHETMLCEGGNKFKIPHLKKDTLLRLGTLPQRLPCTEKACDVATGALLCESHL